MYSPTRPAPLARLAAILAVLALFAPLLACDPSGPTGHGYTLVAVGGTLPGSIPAGVGVEATSGSLVIEPDDRVEQRLDLRCMTGVACAVPEEWKVMTGQLHREDGRIFWDDDRGANVWLVEPDVVTIHHPVPPSWGYTGAVPFRFER